MDKSRHKLQARFLFFLTMLRANKVFVEFTIKLLWDYFKRYTETFSLPRVWRFCIYVIKTYWSVFEEIVAICCENYGTHRDAVSEGVKLC